MQPKLFYPSSHLGFFVSCIALYHMLRRKHVVDDHPRNKPLKSYFPSYRPRCTPLRNHAVGCKKTNKSGVYSPEKSASEGSQGETESEDPEGGHPSVS